jgi:ectoine hydroxylase-related dioxygenase (phytanoyl-CoA dioxygenase family)
MQLPSGFSIIPSFIPTEDLPPLIDEAERLFAEHGRRPAGVRRVLARSRVFAEFTQSERIRSLVAPIVGDRAICVRSLLFDKSFESNWDVAWHQDTTIAVTARADVPGFGPWSIKEGVPHVRPPAEILNNMLTVRIHLDACSEENGPLYIAPGSHGDGIRTDVSDFAEFELQKVACVTDAGGAVLMWPLVFHSSRKALQPTHRRVLHLEFAGGDLPPALHWARQ